MFLPLGSCNQSCCGVLNSLNLGDVFICKPVKQAVALVEFRCNQDWVSSLSHVVRDSFISGTDIDSVSVFFFSRSSAHCSGKAHPSYEVKTESQTGLDR